MMLSRIMVKPKFIMSPSSFQKSEPQTLSEFVALSQEMGIVVKNPPTSVDLDRLAERFAGIEIPLQPLPCSFSYFGGWYSDQWKREVRTEDGRLLFTIRIGDQHICRFHFTLTIEPEAFRLLSIPIP